MNVNELPIQDTTTHDSDDRRVGQVCIPIEGFSIRVSFERNDCETAGSGGLAEVPHPRVEVSERGPRTETARQGTTETKTLT